MGKARLISYDGWVEIRALTTLRAQCNHLTKDHNIPGRFWISTVHAHSIGLSYNAPGERVNEATTITLPTYRTHQKGNPMVVLDIKGAQGIRHDRNRSGFMLIELGRAPRLVRNEKGNWVLTLTKRAADNKVYMATDRRLPKPRGGRTMAKGKGKAKAEKQEEGKEKAPGTKATVLKGPAPEEPETKKKKKKGTKKEKKEPKPKKEKKARKTKKEKKAPKPKKEKKARKTKKEKKARKTKKEKTKKEGTRAFGTREGTGTNAICSAVTASPGKAVRLTTLTKKTGETERRVKRVARRMKRDGVNVVPVKLGGKVVAYKYMGPGKAKTKKGSHKSA